MILNIQRFVRSLHKRSVQKGWIKLHDIKEATREKVLLVGCQTKHRTEDRFHQSMKELAQLTTTAQGEVMTMLYQKRPTMDPATYIGRGKVLELKQLVEEYAIDLVIFNDELQASQVRNLSLHISCRIIDRTQLILDIFARRAQSREGKLQVELAQLSYLLPRLMGQGTALSRLGAGIGTRGPGETQLETDRRHIRRRMDEIKTQLSSIEQHRDRYRERRKRNQVLQVALVGYTNAGKSTLLNRLTDANTLEEDQLFATLDPTTKKLKLPSGLSVLLSDTVGFIEELPTTLIAAFRSTLEEVREADVILHVIDAADEHHFEQEKTVLRLLDELHVGDIPVLTVYNKKDKLQANFLPTSSNSSVFISAYLKEDLALLLKKLEQVIMNYMEPYHVRLQASDSHLLSLCQEKSIISEKKWLEDVNQYEVKGYVLPTISLAKQLKDVSIQL